MPGKRIPSYPPALGVNLAGLDFPTPIGLAAGFDKNAEVPDAMLRLGFGFVEVGTLTPKPQAGNPRPRLFRLVEDGAVINRMGFNNEGQASALKRLALRAARPGIVGVNIGANKDSSDRIADYATGVRSMAPYASYLTVNISSPNTPGLRALQSRAALAELLAAVVEARNAAAAKGAAGHAADNAAHKTQGAHKPLFLKVAPDLEPADVDDIAAVAIDSGIDGLIISNTTISRPQTLASAYASETGGLSGAPLKSLSLDMLRRFAAVTDNSLPLIAAGGIASADDAYARIRAGASLVQLYSALAFHGPGLAKHINTGLLALLEHDGFSHISQAIGVDR